MAGPPFYKAFSDFVSLACLCVLADGGKRNGNKVQKV